MYNRHRDLPVRQYPHPPFPSFAWVMTAQANPPSPAYAHGYIRNAQTHARPRPRAHNSICLPAQRSLPPGLHEYPPSHHPRSSTRPPQSPTRAKTAPILAAERSSDKFMETVDYRYHDEPTRPCVPWLEGYTLPGRGAGTATRQQQDDSEELVVPRLSRAEPPTVPASARVRKCTFADRDSGSADARPKRMERRRVKSKSRAGPSVDIVLSALRRACGLPAKEGRCKPSP